MLRPNVIILNQFQRQGSVTLPWLNLLLPATDTPEGESSNLLLANFDTKSLPAEERPYQITEDWYL